MELMKSYYEISPFFFTITASASLLYFLMNLTMIFGGDSSEELFDANHHVSSDASFKFFSTQTILAFCMGFGWAGITATVKWNLGMTLAVAIALVFGAMLMGLSALLMFRIRKLNHTPTPNLYSSLGTKALVYTTIPARAEGEGQIQVVVSGKQKIVSAVSEENSIASFALVEVVGVKDENTLIVKPVLEKKNAN